MRRNAGNLDISHLSTKIEDLIIVVLAPRAVCGVQAQVHGVAATNAAHLSPAVGTQRWLQDHQQAATRSPFSRKEAHPPEHDSLVPDSKSVGCYSNPSSALRPTPTKGSECRRLGGGRTISKQQLVLFSHDKKPTPEHDSLVPDSKSVGCCSDPSSALRPTPTKGSECRRLGGGEPVGGWHEHLNSHLLIIVTNVQRCLDGFA
ncbi:hypothetical protein RJ55_02926 [Drechmeria coniospora]|nr:hypothetical protein RJ55_02926 [Drechmeria coniospora]